MNRIIRILLFCCVPILNSYGQLNYLIPTTKESILFERIYFQNDKYVIPFDFASPEGSRGAILMVENGNFPEIEHSNINLGLNPMVFINDTPYLVGAPVGNDTTMRIIQLSKDFYRQDHVYDYEILGERTINSGFVSIGDTLYVVNVNNLDDGGIVPRNLQLWITDTDGNLLHTKNLNDHARLTYSHEILNYRKGLLISSSINYYNRLGRYLSLIHLDTGGNEKWHFEGDEAFTDGATIVTAAVLSDSTVVVAYEVNRRDDIEFIRNNWYERPTRLKWFDKNGNPVREKYIIGPEKQELFYSNIEKGNGNYFFAFGEKVKNENRSAVITKYSNNGDTIWSHNYRHAEFIGENPGYQRVIDIYEHEDQSITVLAVITVPGDFPIAWLFKIGEDGCIEAETCKDDILLGEIDTPTINEDDIFVYPNPADNYIIINKGSEVKITETNLYSADGQLRAMNLFNTTNDKIDISFLPPGNYVLSIITERSQRNIKIFKY